MKKVLVAIPYKDTLHPALYERMNYLAGRLVGGNPDYLLDIVCKKSSGPGMFKNTGSNPFQGHANARNALLNRYLSDHDMVMWIDADLVDYPADIITRLDKANPGGVTAPVVLIEGTRRFYDTYGYRQNGKQVLCDWPYFNPTGQLVTLDSVGCAYLIPASVYVNQPYVTMPDQTEHYSIMLAAKKQGLKIACYTDMTIYHANLPLYGENWHGH